MLLAQALGEYGALSALSGAFSSAFASARTYIGGIEPAWALIAGSIVLLWFLIGRVR